MYKENSMEGMENYRKIVRADVGYQKIDVINVLFHTLCKISVIPPPCLKPQ